MEYDDEGAYPAEPEEEERPRDPATDRAKEALEAFFGAHQEEVFHETQLVVRFEDEFFHWITARALHELQDERRIASERWSLKGPVPIRIFRNARHRYWKRQAQDLVALVREYSDPVVTRAVGRHGELMFDAALPRFGFIPKGRDVLSLGGRRWTATQHNLDRVFERDGIEYGVEIKNTLAYIGRPELMLKLEMCRQLGLRPLFICRAFPKSYIHLINLAGGYGLLFRYQLYPFGLETLARRIRERLGMRVDCPVAIEDGTIQRLLNWHQKVGRV